jgi:hypothetical protein
MYQIFDIIERKFFERELNTPNYGASGQRDKTIRRED